MIRSGPEVSLIVSVFNQRRFLPWVLKALSQQDYTGEWELLICDDGSSEEMLPELRTFSETARCEVRYIWQSDHGFRLARSRNNALRCAAGRIAIFTDADVIMESDFLRRHAEAHLTERALVFGNRRYVFLKSHSDLNLVSPLNEEMMENLRRRACLPSAPFQLSRIKSGIPWYSICGCNFSVTNLDAIRFDDSFNGWGLEDCELALRLVTRFGFSCKCVPEIVVYHLEETAAATFHPCRPKSHEEISLYVLNLIHLADAYPDQNLSIVWKTALGFEFEESTGRWGLSTAVAGQTKSRGLREEDRIAEVERIARDWCKYTYRDSGMEGVQ